MIVHRLLDAFFKTLDAVDAVRDRVDRALGREPRPDPWAVEWPPAEPDLPGAPEAEPAEAPPAKNGAEPGQVAPARSESKAKASKAPAKKAAAPASKKPAKKKKASESAKPRPAAKKASASRKGSVDRSGKDFDSPRAQAIKEHLLREGRGVIVEDAEIDGKKVLARVVWALGAAHDAGSELGLTTGDASALLHLAAGMEVFATNIGRACRDHGELIEPSEPDGRSKRYRLTEQGRARAATLETRPL